MTSTASPDFIQCIPGLLDAGDCAAIVQRMRHSDALQPGRVGGGVRPELKHSRDLQITGRADWADVEQALNVAVYGGVLAYLRRYPQALIAPLMLQQTDAWGQPRQLAAEDLAAMEDAALGELVRTCLRPGAINRVPVRGTIARCWNRNSVSPSSKSSLR